MTSSQNSFALSSVSSLTKPTTVSTIKNIRGLEKIEKAAKEFEAIFVTEMMKPMFLGIKSDGIYGGGKAEEVFRDVMLQEYGKKIASTGQLGIANQVRSELIRLQEQKTHENDEMQTVQNLMTQSLDEDGKDAK